MDRIKGKIGFTTGNFDIVHPGYIYTFKAAKKECDYFIVFLYADPSETRYTKYKPVIPIHERYVTLMALEDVDEVVTYETEEDLLHLIEFFKPDVRILGDDYKILKEHLDNPQEANDKLKEAAKKYKDGKK